ncbi:MAG: histidine phosphatase family protein [Clostridia bacterium]|nr:histidine phosphatase family protein [Clostridia bacterium]
MRIYVIRHGESENNLAKKWSGWYDTPLTQKGVEDARAAGEVIRNVRFDKIYSSDLSRAMHTAKTAIPNCEYESSPLLREINVGSLANQPYKETGEKVAAQAFANGYEAFGGESNEHFFGRVVRFANELEASGYKNVAVFTHAGWLRKMLSFVMGLDMPKKNVVCNNCTIGIFEYENGSWRLYSWINVT